MGLVEDVQAHLAAQGLVDGATSWPSVRRRSHDESERLVVISEDGGGAPEMGASGGVGSSAFKDPAVQVRVRGPRYDGDASFAKAQAIFDDLHGRTNFTMNGTTYLRAVAQTSEPVFIGFDDEGRPAHTISFRIASLVGA